jgi:phage terminase large subunit GpA-like protein
LQYLFGKSGEMDTKEISNKYTTYDFDKDLEEIFKSTFVPNDNRAIYGWAGEHVTLNSGYSITGKFDCSISPHFKKIFEAYQDPFIREVNILAPPRSGKTLIAEISLLHTIANNSGDILWLQLSDEKAGQMSDLRMIPLLKSCRPVSELIDLTNKYNITENRYKFLHSTVHITSPKPNALNAVGYKIIFGDEVWKYNGASIIKEIKRRADDYKGVSKCMFFSQGGLKDSAWYEQYHSGQVNEYGWTCPKCSKLQRFEWRKKREDGTFSGIVWPSNERTREGNKWNIKECAKAAVLECEDCRYQVIDNPQTRKYLLDTGDYIPLNAMIIMTRPLKVLGLQIYVM